MARSNDRPKLDAGSDVPDYRDRWYNPTLRPLAPELERPQDLIILDQGQEGACTGFGLAAVVNRLNQQQQPTVPPEDFKVSPRMLYEMARRHDEWSGEKYEGSSCRGAIKGWYHMGVCKERLWPYDAAAVGHLTIERAKDARAQTIGAYYRVRKSIVEMHAALNEVGVLFVSADVHDGWFPTRWGKDGVIKMRETGGGGHAFALVGYNRKGFWVQNSWGEDWGLKGLALWTYEDWKKNVGDAWVVQLALPTPQLYSRRSEARPEGKGTGKSGIDLSGPRRDQIAGHFAHIDDGRFHDDGRYWSNIADVRETADLVARSKDYDHVLFYAHGGLNSVKASATRIAALKDVFKENRVYPYHFMYDTGLLEELKDVVLGKKEDATERTGGVTDWTDRLIEKTTRRPGRALWREMKSDAQAAFESNDQPGCHVLKAFLAAFAAKGAVAKRIHLVGHSTGAILHAHLVQALARANKRLRLGSVSLLAPAATVPLFRSHYEPYLKSSGFGIDRLDVYNLDERLELDDNVVAAYRKSLLYLVSNAFEENLQEAILGMELHSKAIEKSLNAKLNKFVNFHYSDGRKGSSRRTMSTSHGGFDNDPLTMNSVLETILGKKPSRPFTQHDLDY